MAGRPKNSINKEKNLEKNTENNVEIKALENENKKLKNELDEIKKMFLNLTQSQSQVTTSNIKKNIINEIDEDDIDIRPNKYIKVMSLNFGRLVLTTEGKGQGKAFIFNKFGDVKNIVYSDLANLIHHQQSFAEEGRFYVFDKQVIKNHGLIEYYNKFLTKEVIDKILEHNRDELINLFKNTTDTQREVIVNILIKNIVNGRDVDIAKVDIISRLYGQNIYDIARDKISSKEE